jgi:hypothetical protein
MFVSTENVLSLISLFAVLNKNVISTVRRIILNVQHLNGFDFYKLYKITYINNNPELNEVHLKI